MIRHTIFMAALFFAATPALAGVPGFDCAKATRQIDKAICDGYNVGVLDGRMAAAYKTAMAAQEGEAAIASVKAGQKAWLAERDHRCALDNETPTPNSEDGSSPQEFGQFLCLLFIYPPRIAQLMDLAAPPLVPLDVKMVPIEPLRAAYPDDWRQAGYEAVFSPDKTLMVLGVQDSAGYVRQLWLYQPASGRLTAASPQTSSDKTDTPDDISELDSWIWGEDGRFYVRAHRPLGEDSMYSADMDGYVEVQDLPADVAAEIAAREAAFHVADAPETKRPPGFDDDSYNEQTSGAFTVWDQRKGHGSFDLLAARAGDEEPRIIASGGWELEDFLFDPSGTRLFYNGEDGLVVTDPGSGKTRRLWGTRGIAVEVRPITMSANGDILVYWATGSCANDATVEIDPDAPANEDEAASARRVCLAYLEPANAAPAQAAQPVTAGDPWVGEWEGSGAGNLSARIRRGTAKPDYLVVDLVTGVPGCSGAVTLYGRPKGNTVLGESYDPEFRGAPVCRVELSLDDNGVLKTEVAGPCTYYHGVSCGFDGAMTRGE